MRSPIWASGAVAPFCGETTTANPLLPLSRRPYCAPCRYPYNWLGFELSFAQGILRRIWTLNLTAGVPALARAPIAIIVSCLLAAFLGAGCASVPSTSSAHTPSPAGDPPTTSTPPPQNASSVSLAPASVTLQLGQSQLFTATVANDPQSKGVSWSLANCNPGACGTLSATSSASGTAITYTAPAHL